MEVSPEVYFIRELRWQLFATLTFPSRDLGISRRRQLCAWFAFTRTLARTAGVPFKSLFWVLRLEQGEKFGKEHLHCLISGLPPWNESKPGRFAFMAMWEKIGKGMARCAVYDGSQDGAGYICKGLVGTGGAEYELNKFGRTGEVIFSDAAWRAIRRGQHECLQPQGDGTMRHAPSL